MNTPHSSSDASTHSAATRRHIPRPLRVVGILLMLVVGLPALIAGGYLAWLHVSVPGRSEPQRLATLAGAVEIVWDEHAIPHIFADNARDAYAVLGWVHARDRLWQMEMQRRTGQGRLAEVLGDVYLPLDIQMRVLGLYRRAQQDYRALSSELRADLDAYAAGVNAYLARQRGALPIEFHLFGVRPQRWQPADSLVWLRLVAWQLSGDPHAEALRAHLQASVPSETYRAIFPQSPEHAPSSSTLRAVNWTGVMQALPHLGPSSASNAWVADGSLTNSGKPLLANDPHLALEAPVLWYLARIVTPDLELVGATVPGMPFHVLGHNRHIAWGFTTSGDDVADLVVEIVDVPDSERYRTEHGSAAFAVRDEVVRTRAGERRRVRIRESKRGPIISDHDPFFASPTPQRYAVALAFVGLQPADSTAAALRALNRAHDWSSFQAAVALWRSPTLNTLYADVEGNIGIVRVGQVPVRPQGASDLPVMALQSEWTAMSSGADAPQIRNPSAHLIINANDAIGADHGSDELLATPAPASRAQRIAVLLAHDAPFDLREFSRMQLDAKAADATILLPVLLSATASDPLSQELLGRLASWDGVMAVDAAEPLIYAAWFFRLERRLFIRSLGMQAALAMRTLGSDPARTLRLLALQPESQRAELLSDTLNETAQALTQMYGTDVTTWKWGEAHRAVLRPSSLRESRVASALLGTELPVPGGLETVNRGASAGADGLRFPSTHGPGFRGVYDLSDLGRSRFVLATGQSGNPLSSHFVDMARAWSEGETVAITGPRAHVASHMLGRQTFAPMTADLPRLIERGAH